MDRMSIVFVHPPIFPLPSGGNIYNHHMIEQAARINYPLISLPVSSPDLLPAVRSYLATHPVSFLIWDSLFIESLAATSNRLPAMPSALLMHGLPSLHPIHDPTQRTVLRRQENTAIKKMDALLSTGRGIHNTLSRRHPDKSVYLCEPGVDPAFMMQHQADTDSNKTETVSLLTVANLVPLKGYTELLEILSQLSSRPWVWHIVGDHNLDRDYATTFRTKVEALRLKPRIHFHRTLNATQLAALMARMDLFVSASQFETYGMALAEAVAARLTTIVTRVGEAHRLVGNGRSGFLIRAGDRENFKQRLAQLLDSPELRDRFRHNAASIQPRRWEDCFEDFKSACDYHT